MSDVRVSSVWIGDRLSLMERTCVNSFLRLGHPFTLYVYGHVEGIPGGVDVVDAASVLPASEIFRSTNGAVGDFANFFKYHALRDVGGVWTEMDEVCLRPWCGLGPFISSEEGENGARVDQAAIGIEARHPMMESLVERCARHLAEHKGAPFEWGTFGVPAFTAAVEEFGLASRMVPSTHFCPLPWWKAADLLTPGEIPHESFGIQLWNEAWRREGWEKDAAPEGSLYRKLCDWVAR